MSMKSPDQTDIAIGNRLRTMRVMKGLSQTDVANALNVTFQQIQKYEKGVNRLSGGRLLQAAQLFEVTPNTLIIGETYGAKKASVTLIERMLSTSNGVKMATVFMSLTTAQQQACLKVIQSMRKIP